MRNCSGSRELMKEVPNSPMCVPFGFSDKAERSSFIESKIISESIYLIKSLTRNNIKYLYNKEIG